MADGGSGEQPEPSNIVAKVEIVTDGDSGYLSVELVEGEPVADPPATSTARLRRLTGRHRMPATLPAWLPDRATAGAWLRQWWIAVVSGVLILATAVTVAVMVTTRGQDGPSAAEPAGTVPATTDLGLGSADPESAPTSAAAATPTRSPSASTPPASPIDRLAAVAVTAQQLIDSGDLDPRAGREVLRTLATVTTAVRGGRTERAAGRLRQLEERLVELRQQGKLSRAGFEALNVLQPIIAALG